MLWRAGRDDSPQVSGVVNGQHRVNSPTFGYVIESWNTRWEHRRRIDR